MSRTPELPGGTVTFLFTDIEGSTLLLRGLRARYHEVLAEHQRILREAVAEAGGVEIDSQGDSFFFVFRRARDAVLAAANGQRALAAHTWPEDGAVRVRMGIHTGEAAVVDGRYLGVAVHRAARISAAGHGGQVLLSQTTHNLLEDEEELPLELRDLGEQRLKDFERPVRVYQLVIPDLQEHFAPIRTLEPERKQVAREGRRAKWPLLAAAGALAAGAVAAVLAVVLSGGGGSHSVAADSVAVIDPKRNAVVADVVPGGAPTALAAGAGGVWALSRDANTLSKIDPRSKSITGTVALPGKPSDVATGDGAVWVLHSSNLQATEPGSSTALVSRVDPVHVDIQDTFNTQKSFDDTTYDDPIAVGRGVWIGTSGGGGAYGFILRLDPATGKVERTIPVKAGLYGSQALAADAEATWAVSGQGVQLIDPNSGHVTDIEGPGTSGRTEDTVAYLLALGEGKTWVAGEAYKRCGNLIVAACPRVPGVLWRVDPAIHGVDGQARIGRGPAGIAVGAGAVWVGDRKTNSIWRIDPSSLQVLAKIQLHHQPVDIAVSDGAVWVAVAE